MPFKSEAQRKYLWANEPEIARDWTDTYGSGIKAAQGGRIGFQAGTPPGVTGQRTGGGYSDRDRHQQQQDRQREEHWQQTAGQSYVAPVETVAPTSTRDDHAPPGEKGGPGYISPEDLQTLQFKEIIRRGEEEKEDYVAPPKRNIFQRVVDYVKNNPLEAFLNVASFGGYEEAKQALRAIKFAKGAKKFSESEIGTAFTSKFSEWGDEMKKHNAKIDLINSLPKGHPERIQLEESLNYGPYQTTPERDGEGGVEDIMAVEDVNIKIDNVSQLNEDKARLASLELMERNRQQSKENAKRLAYLAAFRQKYLMGPTAMAAQGGRVPQGYNTGGLSNLFRLKNK